jgi:glycolate oxidase iron-sulfur subunit
MISMPDDNLPASAAAAPAARAVAGVDALQVALTDQCVMCGLCLPHCPTYHLDAHEAESPRGRIALARALALGTLEPGAGMLAHLDHCLACLSCQKVCPSGVEYEKIIVRARADLRGRRRRPGLLRRWLHDPRRLTRLARLAAFLRAGRWMPRLAPLLPTASLVRRLAEVQRAPPPLPRWPAPGRAQPRREGIVLFRGCVASILDRDTLAAARRLLEACGHAVHETAAGACCGALPRHHGELAAARHHAAATREEILASGARRVLVTASGCYGDLKDEVAAGADLAVSDALAFLAADPALAELRFRALPARAALHLPCTQVNVVGDTDSARRLLARIPGLEVVTMPLHPRCCGAAGSYFIEQPDRADRLRADKLAQARALAPDLILTTNVGCRMHLGNGLGTDAAAPEVLHPLALLARQLENPTP